MQEFHAADIRRTGKQGNDFFLMRVSGAFEDGSAFGSTVLKLRTAAPPPDWARSQPLTARTTESSHDIHLLGSPR
jgi:hypothetical protein